MDGFQYFYFQKRIIHPNVKCDMDMFRLRCHSSFCGRCNREKEQCIVVHHSFSTEEPGMEGICLDCVNYFYYFNRNDCEGYSSQ